MADYDCVKTILQHPYHYLGMIGSRTKIAVYTEYTNVDPIGAVIGEKGRFSNILEIGEVGAQVKHVAKSIMGSSYAIDRRQL